MEVETSDSKKIFKVFDASKRKRSRKKKDGAYEEFHSINTDESNSQIASTNARGVVSAKASLQNVPSLCNGQATRKRTPTRDRESSPSISNSPTIKQHHSRSPRRHRQRQEFSLALKAGRVSTPKSNSPVLDGDEKDQLPNDQDSFLYAFLEDAIKKDKKRQQRSERNQTEQRDSNRDHRHKHRHRHDTSRERRRKESSPDPDLNQALLLQTFAKICSKLNEKSSPEKCPQVCQVSRIQSHKSLQCENVSKTLDMDQRPMRLRSPEHPLEYSTSRVRSQEHVTSRGRPLAPGDNRDPSYPPNEYRSPRYPSKLDVVGSRMCTQDDKYHDPYIPEPTRSCVNNYPPRQQDRRLYDERRDTTATRRTYDDDRRKYLEQQTSRSFDVQRMDYPDDERFRRTARSDLPRKQYDEQRDYRNKRYEEIPDRRNEDVREKRYDEPKRYEDVREKRYDDFRRYDDHREKYEVRERHVGNLPSKDRRSRRNLDRLERNSVVSRDDDRDRYSERERDSAPSVAEDASTVSGRGNYLRVVKQEIVEQREAMDKMMKLWKELMRCFKGLSQAGAAGSGSGQEKAVQDSAANVQESAAAQLRLWRECMRRYETVARDVGDTDARLMEEINKQRSEMAEMASMWQECLQRYRDMSTDFNNLKQKLATSDSPSRAPAPAPPVCAEGEGAVPMQPYRIPPGYPQMGNVPPGYVGSPLRSRASAPPWWWCGEPQAPVSPRRRSSPDSRGSRDRRHRHKDRDVSRYKEKSKPSGARSEHRHRKR